MQTKGCGPSFAVAKQASPRWTRKHASQIFLFAAAKLGPESTGIVFFPSTFKIYHVIKNNYDYDAQKKKFFQTVKRNGSNTSLGKKKI